MFNLDREEKKAKRKLLAGIVCETPPTLDEMKAGATPLIETELEEEEYEPLKDETAIEPQEVVGVAEEPAPLKKKLKLTRPRV